MEALRRQVSLAAGTAIALTLGLVAGCVTPGSNLLSTSRKPAGPPITSIAAMWQPKVIYGADPTQAGAEVPAILGRAYLFGPDMGFPQLADGDIVAELHPVLPNVPPGHGPALETWTFKKDDLNRACLRRDFLGQGYTLCLRWSTYRPDINQVLLKVRYHPAHGNPIYGESSMLTLNSAVEMTQVARQRQESPGSPAAVAGRPTGAIQQTSASQMAGQMAGQVPARPTAPAANLYQGNPVGAVVPVGGAAPAPVGAPVARPSSFNLGRP